MQQTGYTTIADSSAHTNPGKFVSWNAMLKFYCSHLPAAFDPRIEFCGGGNLEKQAPRQPRGKTTKSTIGPSIKVVKKRAYGTTPFTDSCNPQEMLLLVTTPTPFPLCFNSNPSYGTFLFLISVNLLNHARTPLATMMQLDGRHICLAVAPFKFEASMVPLIDSKRC